MLDTVEQHLKIQEIKASRHTPSINHLRYADDLLLFFKATLDICQNLANILQHFQDMFGFRVNKDKTEIWFCPNTPKNQRNMLVGYFGFKMVGSFGKYSDTYIYGSYRKTILLKRSS